ncbi:magnesium transporter [Oribacterium sp. WCC10]|uniref:magnesium transporter n=1 Tax=Oribacterium sp. WCC10 TaxID=1855343 RepID=UPI0008EA53D0|nr:magnesium transporter [Oribacterium sp. WCC10]SFG83431.1 magnesium transporter [Oribacterium sp. WCC10]
MDELKEQDNSLVSNQETTEANKPVSETNKKDNDNQPSGSNIDAASRRAFLKAQMETYDQDDEPEIPEESRPNLTDLFESIPDDSKKDNEDRNLIHTDSDDFDESKSDEDEDEDELEDLIDEGNKKDISEYYEDMQPADFVEEIDDLDDEDIEKLPEFLNTEQLTEIMEEADDDTRQRIGDHLSDDTLLEMFEEMSKDDIVDILGEMEIARRKRLLNRMKSGDRKIIHTLLQYPDDSAGGIMTTEYIALREDRTCAEALDTIRDIGPKTEVIETIYVTDEDRLKKLVGTVDLRDLLSSPRNTKLIDIMDDQVVSVEPEVDQEEVAQVVSKYDLQAIPVVSSKGSILGIITVDDIIDVINEEHDEDIAHLGGTSAEEGLDTTLWQSVRMRLPWLLINLLTAFLASFTVKVFESTIAQVVALSATMTIVSGMGGNAGTQTMSIMVRELSNGDVDFLDNWKSFLKEIFLGVVDGAATGFVTGIVVGFIYGNFFLGVIIFLAMIGNLVVSGIFGFLVPLTLDKLNADPALASSIFVTTATDVLGFFIFLGLADLFLPLLA